jgi:hypothetical protein
MQAHDTGIITAWRSFKDCGHGEAYTRKEKKQMNKSLQMKLSQKNYRITKVKGSFIENFNTPQAKEVGEDAFFVEDYRDFGNLLKDLRILGEEFEQDSILFIPKGAPEAQLWGTSPCGAWPGIGKTVKFSGKTFGKKGEFMTKVSGRPFYFKEAIVEYISPPDGSYSKGMCAQLSRKHWSELEVD